MIGKKLKHIELNIGKACNSKCVFCMSENSNAHMLKIADFDYIKERLLFYSKEGFNSIGYLGGDISIHPRILDIISLSKELGFKEINIVTNGMLFANYEFARQIVLSGVTRVNLSIHSHLNEVEDFITKIPGGLVKKLKAVDNFTSLINEGLLKSNLSINIVICKINLSNIVETILFFYKNKSINDIRINFIWLIDADNLRKNREELTIRYTDFLPYLKKIILVSLKYKLRITFDTVPACIFYKISKKSGASLAKKFGGEQFDFINQIEHVNVIDENENFNWKDRKKDKFKTQFETCKKCLYKYTCEGIWKEYKDIYGDSEFEPIQ